MIGQYAKAAALLKAVGFTWDKDGTDCFDLWLAAHQTVAQIVPLDAYTAFNRLIMFLAFPNEAIDQAEVNAWIPTPKELADMERRSNFMRRFAV